jgi:alkylated DNA repair dioxygenase AlkB
MSEKINTQSQLDLFGPQSPSVDVPSLTITLPDGSTLPNAEIAYYPSFFDEQEAHSLFSELVSGIAWRQDKMKLYGKEVNLPRQTAWYGDADRNYTFSGITMNPDLWTPALMLIKQKVEPVAKVIFNSVLLNRYRDGNDSISWHTDAEPEF